MTVYQIPLIPIMATLPPAPEATIQIVQCRCANEQCLTNRCQRRKAGLQCKDLCSCSDDDDECENQQGECDDDDSDSEENDDA